MGNPTRQSTPVPAMAAHARADVAAPRGCTNFRLRQLMRRLDQHYDAELSKAGLRTTQYSLLRSSSGSNRCGRATWPGP